MAGRQIDDQSWDLTLAHSGQLCGDDLQMPIRRELGLWIEVEKAARGKGAEVLPQQSLVLGRCRVLDHRSSFLALQPRLPLRDNLFVREAERALLGLRFGPPLDVLQNVDQELEGSPVALGGFVDELLEGGLSLLIRFNPLFSVTTTGSLSASFSKVERFFPSRERPRGLPDRPCLNRV